MRSRLTPYLVAVFALAVALALLVLGTSPPTQNDDPSSRAAGKAGTLALYSWLGDLGFQVHRISGTFDTTNSNVLVIADPRSSISDADADSVMAALAGGTDVVLAVSPASTIQAGPLLNRLRVSLTIARPAGDSVPAQPFDAGDRVHDVPMAVGNAIDPAPYLTPLLTQSGAITAVAEQIGVAGRAYVLASPFPFSNDGLRDADSASLVLSIVERARGGAIAFDEYHHGEITASPDGAAAIFESPLGLALLLGVAAVVVFLAMSGRRLGHAATADDASLVPTTASYIEAMAGLYSRSRDRGAVAARYADELKQRLAIGSGADAGADDEAVLAAVRSTRPELVDDVERVLRRARDLAGARPDAAALLTLARETDALERRWAEPAVASTAQSRG